MSAFAAEPKPFRMETVVEMLRQEGLRITKGRLGILHCLFHADTPLSLQEIQEGANATGARGPQGAWASRPILFT
jgi:hypothetical protein